MLVYCGDLYYISKVPARTLKAAINALTTTEDVMGPERLGFALRRSARMMRILPSQIAART